MKELRIIGIINGPPLTVSSQSEIACSGAVSGDTICARIMKIKKWFAKSIVTNNSAENVSSELQNPHRAAILALGSVGAALRDGKRVIVSDGKP